MIRNNVFVFVATLVAHGVLTWAGPIMAADGWLYARLADGVLAGDWSGVLDRSRLLWTKAIFIAIVAGAKSVAPVGWPHLIVALNVICSAATATLVVSVVRRATGSAAAAWAALLFYVGAFDIFFWNRFVTTDPLYALFATAAFALVAGPILGERPARPFVPLVAALLLAGFSRPPGVVLFFLAFLGVVAFWPRPEGRELPVRRRRLLWLAVAAMMVAGVAFRTYIIQDPSRWPAGFLRPKIEEFAAREKAGEVVIGRAETYRTPPATFADHLVLEAERFVRFFQFLSSGFSPRHNSVNALFFVPLYALGILAVVDGIRTTDRKRRDFVMLMLLWVGVFAYYHALTLLDGLWRYRTPLLPQLIILATCGLDALQAMIGSRRRLSTPGALAEEMDAVDR